MFARFLVLYVGVSVAAGCGGGLERARAKEYATAGDKALKGGFATNALAYYRQAIRFSGGDAQLRRDCQPAMRAATAEIVERALAKLSSDPDEGLVLLHGLRADVADEQPCPVDLRPHEQAIERGLAPVWERAWKRAQAAIVAGHFVSAVRGLWPVAAAYRPDSAPRRVLAQVIAEGKAHHSSGKSRPYRTAAGAFHEHVAAQLTEEPPLSKSTDFYARRLRRMEVLRIEQGQLTGHRCAGLGGELVNALKRSAEEASWAPFSDRIDLHIRSCRLGQDNRSTTRMTTVYDQVPYEATESVEVERVRVESTPCQTTVCLSGSGGPSSGPCRSTATIGRTCRTEHPYTESVTRTVTRYRTVERQVPVTDTSYRNTYTVVGTVTFTSDVLGQESFEVTASVGGRRSSSAQSADETAKTEMAARLIVQLQEHGVRRAKRAAALLAERVEELVEDGWSPEADALVVLGAFKKVLDDDLVEDYFERYYGLDDAERALLVLGKEGDAPRAPSLALPDVSVERADKAYEEGRSRGYDRGRRLKRRMLEPQIGPGVQAAFRMRRSRLSHLSNDLAVHSIGAGLALGKRSEWDDDKIRVHRFLVDAAAPDALGGDASFVGLRYQQERWNHGWAWLWGLEYARESWQVGDNPERVDAAASALIGGRRYIPGGFIVESYLALNALKLLEDEDRWKSQASRFQGNLRWEVLGLFAQAGGARNFGAEYVPSWTWTLAGGYHYLW